MSFLFSNEFFEREAFSLPKVPYLEDIPTPEPAKELARSADVLEDSSLGSAFLGSCASVSRALTDAGFRFDERARIILCAARSNSGKKSVARAERVLFGAACANLLTGSFFLSHMCFGLDGRSVPLSRAMRFDTPFGGGDGIPGGVVRHEIELVDAPSPPGPIRGENAAHTGRCLKRIFAEQVVFQEKCRAVAETLKLGCATDWFPSGAGVDESAVGMAALAAECAVKLLTASPDGLSSLRKKGGFRFPVRCGDSVVRVALSVLPAPLRVVV